VASIAKRPDGTSRLGYRNETDKEHARNFKRKVDAQRWLDEVTPAMVTGDHFDPAAGKITVRAWFKELAPVARGRGPHARRSRGLMAAALGARADSLRTERL
jgi:hypothetical protein